ncbi:glycosyltransferase [Roseococcus microcysteis]|uniref:glycosyltransferase n=1 Tax=Roseococcus microcysteis TaxID=2771361 RepID=UPI00168B0CA9|nr:glycosyltransferase [Roseococcus microcysteis]
MSGVSLTRPSVCVLSHAHPDFSKGGGEIAAYRHYQTMRGAGWNTTFVAAADLRPAGTKAGLPPLPVVMPYAEGEHLITTDRMTEDRLYWEDADQRRALVRFLAGLQVDVYHFHHYWRLGMDMIADLVEARPDAHFVMTLHEMLAICLHHGQMIKTRGRELCNTQSAVRCLSCFPSEGIDALVLRKAYMLKGLQCMDHLIYCSEFLQARYLDWGLHNRGSVLENYLGDDMLALPRPKPSGTNSHRFAFFGQPTAFKGLDVLLRAMALLPKAGRKAGTSPLLLVFGAEQADVLRLFPNLAPVIEALGQSVIFAGRYESSDVIPLMRSVGWVVVPSIWWENSPVVIQEARRAGTPLIVSDIGGMAEKVTPGRDGLHFRRNSATDLAETLEYASKSTVRAQFAASVEDVIDRDTFLAGLAEAYAPTAARAPFRQQQEAVS